MGKKLGLVLVFCSFFGTSPGTILRAFAQLSERGVVPAHSVAIRN